MTKRRTRQVLAVLLLTTALCADRGSAAPSAARTTAAAEPAAGSLAGRWIGRLSRGFAGAVASAVPRQARRPERVAVAAAAVVVDQSLGLSHLPVSPFEFRLPPPLLA